MKIYHQIWLIMLLLPILSPKAHSVLLTRQVPLHQLVKAYLSSPASQSVRVDNRNLNSVGEFDLDDPFCNKALGPLLKELGDGFRQYANSAIPEDATDGAIEMADLYFRAAFDKSIPNALILFDKGWLEIYQEFISKDKPSSTDAKIFLEQALKRLDYYAIYGKDLAPRIKTIKSAIKSGQEMDNYIAALSNIVGDDGHLKISNFSQLSAEINVSFAPAISPEIDQEEMSTNNFRFKTKLSAEIVSRWTNLLDPNKRPAPQVVRETLNLIVRLTPLLTSEKGFEELLKAIMDDPYISTLKLRLAAVNMIAQRSHKASIHALAVFLLEREKRYFPSSLQEINETIASIKKRHGEPPTLRFSPQERKSRSLINPMHYFTIFGLAAGIPSFFLQLFNGDWTTIVLIVVIAFAGTLIGVPLYHGQRGE